LFLSPFYSIFLSVKYQNSSHILNFLFHRFEQLSASPHGGLFAVLRITSKALGIYMVLMSYEVMSEREGLTASFTLAKKMFSTYKTPYVSTS
jgi:hypothetical protein